MNALTQDQRDKLAAQRKGQYRTLVEAADHLGVEPKVLVRLRAEGVLRPDAILRRKQRGRPAHLFSGKTLQQVRRELASA